MKFQRKKVAAALGIGGIALLAAGAVIAQDIRVNVTGSNIKRADTETAAPIETITRQDIQQSGLQNITDVVRQITASSNGSISDAFINGFGAGGSGVSLRGLGVNNTLVLLNGRRLASYGLADDGQRSFTDLNQIPFDAVERIEVLKDGASAIYGSDAVAGVINIILRQQFTGVSVTGSYGVTKEGDGDIYKGAVTFGFGDLTKDRYNVFVNIDAQKQEEMRTNNRPEYIGSQDLRFMGLPDTRNGNRLSGFGAGSLTGVLRPISAANPAGPATGPDAILPGCNPANVDPDGYCRFESKDFLQVQPETERFNILGKGTFNFTNTLQGYAELSYFQSKVNTTFTPTTIRSTWPNARDAAVISSVNAFLPVGHPDNPFGPGTVGRLYYTTGDIGGRDVDHEASTQRYLVGLKGTNWGWDWDSGLLFIRTETSSVNKGYVNYANLLQALNGQGGFGYYRIGANAHLNNPGIYGFIAPNLTQDTTSENTQFDIKASRDLMKLDGGQLGLAVGYEYRKEELDNPGLPGTAAGELIGRGGVSGAGSRNVNAVYAELYAPILRNLELTGALRYDRYSDYGSSTTPKFGAKWTPIPQVVLRGTYAQGFRAPGLYENGNSAVGAFTTVVDPVRCPITNAPGDCSNPSVVAITSGNPQIEPEESDSYTLGFILEPIPGLSGSLDYWNFKTKQQIQGSDPQAVVNNPSGFPAAVIIRDPSNNLPGIPNSGTLLAVSAPYENANEVETDGIDFDVRYRWNLRDYGNLTTALQWTHILHFKRTLANGTTNEFAGTHGPTALSSSAGMPQDRGNLIISWDRGPWNVAGTVRYVSGMDDFESKEDTHCLNFEEFCKVSSFTTLDLAVSYKGFKNWEIFGSVLNVFDEIAPFDRQAGYQSHNFNYNYALSGAIGTQFNLGARYTFK